MASTIALKRVTAAAASSSILSKLSNPVRYSASLAADLDLHRSRCDSLHSSLLRPGLIDPFPPKRTLSQIMDPFFNSLLGVGGSIGSSGFSSRQMWDMMGEEKGLHLKMAVPEQGKQDVKVNVGSDSSAIKGSGGKGSEDGDGGKKYSTVVARGVIGTALFPISLFVHINEGMEEIIADYVHHEMTRNYILVSMRLFLLIAAKDACVSLFF